MGLVEFQNEDPALKRWAISIFMIRVHWCRFVVAAFHELALEYRRRANDQNARERQNTTVDATMSWSMSGPGWPKDLIRSRAGILATITTGIIQPKMILKRRGKIASG